MRGIVKGFVCVATSTVAVLGMLGATGSGAAAILATGFIGACGLACLVARGGGR